MKDTERLLLGHSEGEIFRTGWAVSNRLKTPHSEINSASDHAKKKTTLQDFIHYSHFLLQMQMQQLQNIISIVIQSKRFQRGKCCLKKLPLLCTLGHQVGY